MSIYPQFSAPGPRCATLSDIHPSAAKILIIMFLPGFDALMGPGASPSTPRPMCNCTTGLVRRMVGAASGGACDRRHGRARLALWAPLRGLIPSPLDDRLAPATFSPLLRGRAGERREPKSPCGGGPSDFLELFTNVRLTVGVGAPYKPHTGGAVDTFNRERLTVFTSFDGLLGHLAAMPGRRSCCLFCRLEPALFDN